MPADYNGFRNAALKQYPGKQKEIDAFIEKKRQAEATKSLVESGVLDVTKVAESDPVIAAELVKGGAKPKLSAADQKKVDAQGGIMSLIDSLEKQYSEAGAGDITGGLGARAQGLLLGAGGKLGLNDAASVYNLTRSGMAATLKSLTGDTGVLTEPDYQRLAGLVPGLGATTGEAKDLFNQLRGQVSAKFGQGKTETTFSPKKTQGTGEALIDLLLGNSIRTAKDIGAGINANTTESRRADANNSAFETARQLENRAMETENMEERKALLAEANKIHQGISDSEGEISRSFSKDITKPYVQRGLEGGAEIAGNAALAGSLAKVPQAARGATKLLSPIKNLSKARADAITSVGDVSTQGIKAAGEKYLSSDPLAKKMGQQILDSIPDKLSGTNLYERINVWNKAYTAAQTVGKSSKAGLYDALARAAKQEIVSKAPNVGTYNKLFSTLYAGEKLGKNIIGPSILGYFLYRGLDKISNKQ